MSYHNHNESILGKTNRLTVIQSTKMGLILDGDILLPHSELPPKKSFKVGDSIDVFIYEGQHHQLIATTKKPYTQVGRFADLQVAEINDFGIFLDWGLPKDLLLPFSEEVGELQAGDFAIVYTYIDEKSGRITASMKLEQFLDKGVHRYHDGDEVHLLVAEETDLGLKVIVDNAYWGLIYHNDVHSDLAIGDEIPGFIKHVRDDGKLDIIERPVINTPEARDSLEEKILRKISEYGGTLPIGDKSSPDEIFKILGVSKSAFKRAIGGLYKAQKIIIQEKRIIKNL